MHLTPKRARVDTDHDHTDQVATDDADRTEHGGQQGHGNQAAPETRRQDAPHRVHGHHLHRRQLLAGLHQADLGGQRRARAARKQKRGHHGPQFTHQAQGHQQAQRLGRAVTLQRVIPLQTQHKTNEEPRDGNDGQRVVAEKKDLVAHQTEAAQGRP